MINVLFKKINQLRIHLLITTQRIFKQEKYINDLSQIRLKNELERQQQLENIQEKTEIT